MNLGKLLKFLVAFALPLAYFVTTYSYYQPIHVDLEGRAGPDTKLAVYFITGEAFTTFEKIELQPLKGTNPPPGSAEPMPFHSALDLPNMPIKKIKIQLSESGPATDLSLDSVKLTSGSQELIQPKAVISKGAPLEISCLGIKTKTFRKLLFAFQVALAALVAWLLLLLSELPKLTGRSTWRETLRSIFVEEKRWFFWTLFLVSSAVHLLWLLAYWPGAMTNDSWSTLSEVKTLKFANWHPFIYAFYVLALMQFFDSIATIALFQIAVTAAVMSYIFYHCYRSGVRLILVAPFAALFVFSIPAALHSITIWKDVPFSVAILACSFIIFRIHERREAGEAPFRFFTPVFPLLVLALTILLHSRHNGVVFYVAIPILVLGGLSKRQYVGMLVTLGSIFLIVAKILPSVLHVPPVVGSAYHELRTVLSITTHYNFYSENREADYKAVERFVGDDWAKISSLFPRDFFTINDHPAVMRHQFSHREGDPTNWPHLFIPRLILENLPIFISFKTWEFLHSIGIDSPVSDQRTNNFQDPLQLQGSNLHPPGYFMYSYAIAAEPKLPQPLVSTITSVDEWSRTYHGLLSPSVLVWNLLAFLGLFGAVLFIERGTSAIALFLLPSLLNALCVFVVGPGESWRYFYSIYLCGLVLVPLYAEYALHRSRRA